MGRSLARQAFDTAQRAGDLTYAAFSCNFLLTELHAESSSLAEVQREAEAGLVRASGAVRSRGRAHHRTPPVDSDAPRADAERFGSFDDVGFDGERFERQVEASQALR